MEQSSPTEGNSKTKAILGNRVHRESRFWDFEEQGKKDSIQGNMETGNQLTHPWEVPFHVSMLPPVNRVSKNNFISVPRVVFFLFFFLFFLKKSKPSAEIYTNERPFHGYRLWFGIIPLQTMFVGIYCFHVFRPSVFFFFFFFFRVVSVSPKTISWKNNNRISSSNQYFCLLSNMISWLSNFSILTVKNSREEPDPSIMLLSI